MDIFLKRVDQRLANQSFNHFYNMGPPPQCNIMRSELTLLQKQANLVLSSFPLGSGVLEFSKIKIMILDSIAIRRFPHKLKQVKPTLHREADLHSHSSRAPPRSTERSAYPRHPYNCN